MTKEDYVKVGTMSSSIETSTDEIELKFANDKKSGIADRLFKVLMDFCDQTSLHGLNQISPNRLITVKFLWILVFVAACVGNHLNFLTPRFAILTSYLLLTLRQH